MQIKTSNYRKGSSRNHRHHQMMSDINITPFVDVMLVLLIIFMISAPMLIGGVHVNLPSNSSASNVQTDPFIISVREDGVLFVSDQEVKIENIAAVLKDHLVNDETKIHVRGDKNINYGEIMSVIAEVNKAGFKKISLITEVSN